MRSCKNNQNNVFIFVDIVSLLHLFKYSVTLHPFFACMCCNVQCNALHEDHFQMFVFSRSELKMKFCCKYRPKFFLNL